MRRDRASCHATKPMRACAVIGDDLSGKSPSTLRPAPIPRIETQRVPQSHARPCRRRSPGPRPRPPGRSSKPQGRAAPATRPRGRMGASERGPRLLQGSLSSLCRQHVLLDQLRLLAGAAVGLHPRIRPEPVFCIHCPSHD